MKRTVFETPVPATSPHGAGLEHFIPRQASVVSEKIEGYAEVAGARVNYTYENPLESTDDVPALIVPGYVGIKPAYDRFRSEIVQTGKPAITLRPVRSQALSAALHPNYLLHPTGLPSRMAYGVLSDIQQRHGIDRFDAVGHSMGGLVVSLVAQRHPDKIRSASFVASAGLEDHSLAVMSKRLPSFLQHELIPNVPHLMMESEARALYEMFYYIWRNPLRTCVEGIAVSHCDIRPALPRLGELGIKTAVLNFASDRLTCNQSIEDEVGPLVDHLETHPRRELGHLAPQLEPKLVATYVTNIIDTITAPKNKQA